MMEENIVPYQARYAEWIVIQRMSFTDVREVYTPPDQRIDLAARGKDEEEVEHSSSIRKDHREAGIYGKAK